MLKSILSIGNLLKDAFKFNFVTTKEENDFRKTLARQDNRTTTNKDILLVPLLDDLGTMKIVIKLANIIADQENLTIKYFFAHAAVDNNYTEASKLWAVLKRLNNWSYISIATLRRAYNIRAKDLIMSNHFLPVKPAKSNYDKFKSKADILKLKHKGIELGELLYDTYLRFRSKPTIDVDNDELYEFKNYIVDLTDKWDDFFIKNKVAKLLMPYMAYHHWGVPGKTAIKHNVEVITFGSFLYILQQISSNYPYHTKNFKLYPEVFNSLDGKEGLLNEAKLILENRLTGGIDKGISYMKNSAFNANSSNNFKFNKDKKWAVIFLHCFFDSPHIYGDGLFSDFYDWIIYLLNKASQNPGVLYYVKEHPNGLPENAAVITEIKNRYAQYSNIIFLSKEISNKLIVESKPDAIFTYYGTVAHEFSYHGIPAITCGENPHSRYDFLYNAKTIDELDYFLQHVGDYALPEKYEKADILEFFYMHYIYYSPKYNQLNFELGKSLERGQVNIPDQIPLKDLIYGS